MVLPHLHARLLLNASEGPKTDIALRVGDGHSTGFRGMLELDVAALLSRLSPPPCFKRRDNVPAPHVCMNTHPHQAVNVVSAMRSRREIRHPLATGFYFSQRRRTASGLDGRTFKMPCPALLRSPAALRIGLQSVSGPPSW